MHLTEFRQAPRGRGQFQSVIFQRKTQLFLRSLRILRINQKRPVAAGGGELFHKVLFRDNQVPLEHGVGEETDNADGKRAAGFVWVLHLVAHLYVQCPHAGVHIHHGRHSAAVGSVQQLPAITLGKRKSFFVDQLLGVNPKQPWLAGLIKIQATGIVSFAHAHLH